MKQNEVCMEQTMQDHVETENQGGTNPDSLEQKVPEMATQSQMTEQTDSADAREEEASDEAEDLTIIRQYLDEHYELRVNVVAAKLEFRLRDGKDASFRQLTYEAENSIVLAAMQTLGKVKNLKTILSLLLHSEEVKQYDPVHEYLSNLPHWDGQNRVADLFGRLPGISSENILRCSIWMRSAVAHWLKMDALHGNESVPTLIGEQGCGKTVFCRRLLPPILQPYFLDRMNLSNKFDKDMALTNNMLVVLDEFDQYTTRQQAALKHAMSRSVVNARPILKGAQVVRHRYASFLATTNNERPLNDPTGSRRYICIRLTPGAIIDNDAPIDYDQLYAQVVEEVVVQKKRYWFDADETRQIQLDNVPFQHEVDIHEMVNACFVKPKSADDGCVYSMNEIVELIAMRYPYVSCNMAMKMRVGGVLRKMGYAVRHNKKGNSYVLQVKPAA